MSNLVKFFVENHTSALLFTLALIFGGLLTIAFSVKFEAIPDMSPEQIEINLEYSGATPEEIDQSIILPIVEKLSNVNGIKKYAAISYDSSGRILLDVENKYDKHKLRYNVSSQVQKIKGFPKNSEKPVICEVDILTPVIKIAIFGNCQKSALKFWAERIKELLLEYNHISRVKLEGSFEPRICVEVSQEKLRHYNLSLPEVFNRLSENHSDRSVGRMESNSYVFKLKNITHSIYTIKEIPVITYKDGSSLTIGQVADVYIDNKNRDNHSNRFNGASSVSLVVHSVGNQNAVKIANSVNASIDFFSKYLPNNINIETFDNTAKELKDRLRMIFTSILWSIFLVIMVVGFFLGFKLALLLSAGMLACSLGSIILFPVFNLSVNLISLFSFMLVMGIIIDDSIIVSENICRKVSQGISVKKAVIEGSKQVLKPVLCATLTTIAAFMPFYFMKGQDSKLMDNIYLVVVVILTVSLIEAFLALPAHMLYIKIRSKKDKKNILIKLLRIYIQFVRKTVEYRYLVLIISCFILLTFWNLLSTDFFQSKPTKIYDTSKIEVKVETRPGISEKQCEKITDEIVEYAKQAIKTVSEEYNVDVKAGNFFTNMFRDVSKKNYNVYVTVELNNDIPEFHDKIILKWEKMISKIRDLNLSYYNGQEENRNTVTFAIKLDHNNDIDQIISCVKRELSSLRGVIKVEDSLIKDNNEIELSMTPMSRIFGLSSNDIMSQLRSSVLGVDNLRNYDGKNEIILRITSPEDEASSIEELTNYPIITSSKSSAHIKDVSNFKLNLSNQFIQRLNGKVVIFCTLFFDKTINRHTLVNFLENVAFPTFSTEFPDSKYEMTGRSKAEQEAQSDFLLVSIVAFFVIYAIIAIAFNSFIQPALIFSIVPFGVLGAIFAHKIFGLEVTSLSWFGVSGMLGVAVNDSLVLIDCINRTKKITKDILEAVIISCKKRIRPILLTTITTFMGVSPLIIQGPSAKTAFILPIAISVAFGVLFGTGAILLLLPAYYIILNDIKVIFSGRKNLFKQISQRSLNEN